MVKMLYTICADPEGFARGVQVCHENTVVKPRISIFEHADVVLCSHARYSVMASTQDILIWLILSFCDVKHQLKQTLLLSKYTLYNDCLRTRA